MSFSNVEHLVTASNNYVVTVSAKEVNERSVRELIVKGVRIIPTTINYNRPVYTISFDSELSAEQVHSVKEIVRSAEETDDLTFTSKSQYGFANLSVDSGDYTLIHTFEYDGTFAEPPIKKLRVRGYIDSYKNEDTADPNFFYQVRVVDVIHNTVLGESTFSNNESAIGVLPVNSNLLPVVETEIDVQVRKGNMGKRVYIQYIDVIQT